MTPTGLPVEWRNGEVFWLQALAIITQAIFHDFKIYIRSITIANLKLIRNLEMSFTRDAGPRMWTVLVGENGLCKTSILQAIALTALGADSANAFQEIIPSLPDRRRPNRAVKLSAAFDFGIMGHTQRLGIPGRQEGLSHFAPCLAGEGSGGKVRSRIQDVPMLTETRKFSMILLRASAILLLALASLVPARGDAPQSASKTKAKPESIKAATKENKAGGSKPVSFMGDVAPILVRNCIACHNPKKSESKNVMTRGSGRGSAEGARSNRRAC